MAPADAEEEREAYERRGGAQGAAVVTQKEVLRQAANWVRIMSVVSRPNASEEQTQGCFKGGDSLGSEDWNQAGLKRL